MDFLMLVNTFAMAVIAGIFWKMVVVNKARGDIILKQSAQLRLYRDLHERILRDYEELTYIKNFDLALAKALLELPTKDYFRVVDLVDALALSMRKLCAISPEIYKEVRPDEDDV